METTDRGREIVIRMKILIVYKSATGFTRKYAEIIGEALSCPVTDHRFVTAETLSEYDTVVFGSRAHAGMIDGYKKMREMFQKSRAGHLVLFVTGATPNAAEEIIAAFWKQNLSADELSQIPHFYMQAGLCYERMSFADKMMMKAAAAMLKKKKDKSDSDRAFEKAISCSYDISDEKYVEPLITFLRAGSFSA